jgi:hypothetical protein
MTRFAEYRTPHLNPLPLPKGRGKEIADYGDASQIYRSGAGVDYL